MSAVQSVSVTLCYTCVAVSILSTLIPQKRTRRMMHFVIALFFISTFMTAVSSQLGDVDLSIPETGEITVPSYSEYDMNDAVAQMTADNLTQSLNELLLNEGIKVQDIQLSLKISEEGRITVVRAVIYINEAARERIADIKSIIYRNISKEPEIYVTGEESLQLAE